jgi:hypothetical protein
MSHKILMMVIALVDFGGLTLDHFVCASMASIGPASSIRFNMRSRIFKIRVNV